MGALPGGPFALTRERVGTREGLPILRTLVDPGDLAAAQAPQDPALVEQASAGRFEVPDWRSRWRRRATPWRRWGP
jgi:hypothetical protein